MRSRTQRIRNTASAPASRFERLGLVRWSPLFVAFLGYVFVITTYQLNAATLMMSAALVALLLQREPWRLPAPVLWVGALVLWEASGYFWSSYQPLVAEATLEDAKVWLVLLVLVNAVRTRAQLHVFIIFFLACFAFYPVRGALFNYFIYQGTTLGRTAWNYIYSNPNDLAAFCILAMSVAAGAKVVSSRKWIRSAAFLGTWILPLVILLTQSRGGIVALIVYYVIVLRTFTLALRKVVVAVGCVAVIALLTPDTVWQRLSGLTRGASTGNLTDVDEEGSAEQRYEIWKVAANIISDRPLAGTGRGTYKVVHATYAISSAFKPTAQGERDTHSLYLNLWAETGLIGVALFGAALFSTYSESRKARRRCAREHPRMALQMLFLEAGLAAYLVAGVFGSLGHVVFTYIHLGIMHVTARAALAQTAIGAIAETDLDLQRSLRSATSQHRWRLP